MSLSSSSASAAARVVGAGVGVVEREVKREVGGFEDYGS